MPPSLRTRNQPGAGSGAPPLEGVTVTLSGKFEGKSQASIEARLRALGASVSRTLATTTAVLVTTRFEYQGATSKVAQAKSRALPIVGLDWLEACEEQKKNVSWLHYDYGAPSSPSAVTPDPGDGEEKSEDAAKADVEDGGDEETPNAAAAAGSTNGGSTKGTKRGAADVAGDAAEPPAKRRTARSRGKRGEVKADDAKVDDAEADDAEAEAKADDAQADATAGSKADAKADAGDEEEAVAVAPSKRGAKANKKKVAEEKPDATTASTDTKGQTRQAGTEVDGQYARGRDVVVPADPRCILFKGKVYIDPDSGLIYDAHLNQSNHAANANKFYRVQLLVSNTDDNDFRTWTRWGRVGEVGSHGLLGRGSFDEALKTFKAKFTAKTGLTWEQRDDAPKRGKYAFAQQNYEESAEELEKKIHNVNIHGRANQADSSGADGGAEMPSKLEPAVQGLMQLIFNQQYMQAAMASMKYDARRLPLGKLSKVVIIKAYRILKDLTDLINDPTQAMPKYAMGLAPAVEMLSNQYYTYIPHDFGRSRIPILNTVAAIKPEIDLLDSLVDMKEASDLMTAKDDQALKINKLDTQFASLGLDEMSVLDEATDEYKLISAYLNESRGLTHHISYQVENIFRIERPREEDRLTKFKLPGAAQSDRRLLWHGSRATNFGGILSQGLRIAPPEAPVSGYMFGKGIYLADMSSKSAGYTAASYSGGTGLLLLCEAEVGSPMLELRNSDYNAGSKAKSNGSAATWGQGRHGPSAWKDASCVHPSLKGVKMPDTTTLPGPTNLQNASLWYNEYICYDVSQVRLRYLLRVKM